MPDIEILKQYNSEIVSLYNYYSIANNASMMHRFKYVMEYSIYKTFAAKYKSTISKIKIKFNSNGKFAIKYLSKKDYTPKSLISRLLKNRCEWCFKPSKNIEVHHVRKLKNLGGIKKGEKVLKVQTL